MVKFIGQISVNNTKTETPRDEAVKQKFEEEYGIKITDKEYSIVYVPTRILGSATYALFKIGD